jgi:multidrug efflux pump subunit AcrB
MIRKFIRFSIEKPSLNHIFLIFLIVLAIFSYQRIPKEIFPPFQLDKVSVSGYYSGASSDVLDKMVVQTLEDELKNISELESITTVIQNGSFSIQASLKPDSNQDLILNDVKDLITKAKRDLPSDMDEPTVKVVESVIPLVLVAIAGSGEKKELLEVADKLKSRLSEFKDLSDISIRGDADEQLLIRLREEAIEGYGLQVGAVIGALRNISAIFPIGTIKEQGQHLYLSTINGEKDLQSIENTLLSVGGRHIYIRDIADVSYELETPNEISHYNGVQNISVNINKSKTGNSIQLVKDIRGVLAEFQVEYPKLQFEVYTDTSVWIKNRLNTVISNIVFGLFLVFTALFLSVNWGIATVVAMGIPMSFIIGLISIDLLGYSLNMLSLLGALIALGMLVDEAIVVAENIYRHMEMGKDRKSAVIDGASEMFPAVLTATLTTVFAFLPLLLMTGEMGQFMRILPIIISVLLISSLLEAFYFLPLHGYQLIRVRNSVHKSHTFWNVLYSFYGRFLNGLLVYKWITLPLIVGSILYGTVVMFQSSKIQLFPDFDTTQIYIKGKVNINSELQDTEKLVTEIEKKVLLSIDEGEVKSVTSVIGMRLDGKNKAEMGEHLFQVFIDLHERKPENFFNKHINPLLSPEYDPSLLVRSKPAKEIAEEIDSVIENYKDSFDEISVIVPGAGIVKSDVEIAFSHSDNSLIEKSIEKITEKMGSISGVSNIENDAKEGETELKLRVNEYGLQLGFTEVSLINALQPLYLQAEYSKMFNSSGLIRMKIEKSDKDYFDKLKNLNIAVPNSDRRVRVDEVCDFFFEKGYAYINKEDGERIKTVFASLDKSKVTSSELMQNLQPTLKEIEELGVKVIVKGEEQENKRMQKEIGQAALIAIFLIFITLVWMFDSVKMSLIIVSTIPLSILGVLIGHQIMGINLTMPGMIGIVGLAGVVVNDALIMVDFIRKGETLDEIVSLAIKRLRPIILTSFTTALGLSTLIFFASGQALILQPMAVSLGFGVLWATVLNLIYVPLLYSVIFRVKSSSAMLQEQINIAKEEREIKEQQESKSAF